MLKRFIVFVSLILIILGNQACTSNSVNQKNDRPIGVVTMKDDYSLSLFLNAETEKVRGHTVLEYKVGDDDYERVLEHVGDIKPGESKSVLPLYDNKSQLKDCGKIDEYRLVKELFLEGKMHHNNQAYKTADALFIKGISILGDRYYSDSVVDHSSLNLTVADIEQKNDDIEYASSLRLRALGTRLYSYHIKFECYDNFWENEK